MRERLTAILSGLVRGLTDSEWAPAVSPLVDASDRDSEIRLLVHDFLVDRMAPARAILAEAIEAGDLPRSLDIDLGVSMLAGPIFYRRLISRETIDAAFASAIVDQFLHFGGRSS